MDMSASVAESDSVPFVVQAATAFTDELERHHKVVVFDFDGSEKIHKIQDFTASAGASHRGVAALSSFKPRDPSTNLHGAIIEAVKHLDDAVDKSRAPLRFGTLVVFTDGMDRAGRKSNAQMLDALENSNLDVFAIGVGSAVKEGNGTGKLSYQFDATGFGPKCDPRRPPPFDTSGARGFKPRRPERTGIRLELKGSGTANAN